MADSKRLIAILNQAKLQTENPSLYQVIVSIINELTAPVTTVSPNVSVMEVDTRTSAQTINLNLIGTNKVVVKDKYGNAFANNITINATVDGVVNPVINTNYGLFRVYSSDNGFHQW